MNPALSVSHEIGMESKNEVTRNASRQFGA
jgi:hypothetical protein